MIFTSQRLDRPHIGRKRGFQSSLRRHRLPSYAYIHHKISPYRLLIHCSPHRNVRRPRCWLSACISTTPSEIPHCTRARCPSLRHYHSAGYRHWPRRPYDIQSRLDPCDDRLGCPRLSQRRNPHVYRLRRASRTRVPVQQRDARGE
jgi:hypothetical protein